jgi:putative effector of murein hydrolase
MQDREVIMFEHRSAPLLPRRMFVRRLALFSLIAVSILLVSLFLGILGYHYLEGLSWIDSLLNAAMILGGMGPVNVLQTDAGKWFASLYALFAGVVFLVVAGVIFAPVFHRFFHSLNLDLDDQE